MDIDSVKQHIKNLSPKLTVSITICLIVFFIVMTILLFSSSNNLSDIEKKICPDGCDLNKAQQYWNKAKKLTINKKNTTREEEYNFLVEKISLLNKALDHGYSCSIGDSNWYKELYEKTVSEPDSTFTKYFEARRNLTWQYWCNKGESKACVNMAVSYELLEHSPYYSYIYHRKACLLSKDPNECSITSNILNYRKYYVSIIESALPLQNSPSDFIKQQKEKLDKLEFDIQRNEVDLLIKTDLGY